VNARKTGTPSFDVWFTPVGREAYHDLRAEIGAGPNPSGEHHLAPGTDAAAPPCEPARFAALVEQSNSLVSLPIRPVVATAAGPYWRHPEPTAPAPGSMPSMPFSAMPRPDALAVSRVEPAAYSTTEAMMGDGTTDKLKGHAKEAAGT
jgi:hypothetical protein